MIKIAHVEEVTPLKLSQEVIKVIQEISMVLDNEYGENRSVDRDNGGYVLIIQSEEDFIKLKNIYIDINDVIVEYIDLITVKGGEDYYNILILLNSDFAVSLIIPKNITPKSLLDQIQ